MRRDTQIHQKSNSIASRTGDPKRFVRVFDVSDAFHMTCSILQFAHHNDPAQKFRQINIHKQYNFQTLVQINIEDHLLSME